MKKEKKFQSLKVTEFLLISGLDMLHPKVYLYICIQIQKEQKIYSEVVPKTVDEYLSLIEKYLISRRERSKY